MKSREIEPGVGRYTYCRGHGLHPRNWVRSVGCSNVGNIIRKNSLQFIAVLTESFQFVPCYRLQMLVIFDNSAASRTRAVAVNILFEKKHRLFHYVLARTFR